MTNRIRSSATTATAALALAGLVLALTACANITNLVQKQHEESYPTFAAAEKDWVGVEVPSWIPEDATQLRNLATFDETVSVIRVTSESPLVGDCPTDDRRGIPALTADWSTDDWPNTVSVCGDYEVMPYDGGWVGWFNAQTEGQTPAGA